MPLSIFFAQLFGLYFLVAGFFYLFRKERYQEAVRDLYAHTGLQVTSGALSVLVGLAIVLLHSVWVWDWPVIITLIGYGSIIKGIILFFFSDHQIALKMARGHNPIYFGIGYLILALLLIYEGFIE